MAKQVSEHIQAVLVELEKVTSFSAEERIKTILGLHKLFKEIQGGASIVTPLYPPTDKITAVVETYRKKLKSTDIIDDTAGPLMAFM